MGRVFPYVWVGPYFVWKVVTLGFAGNCKASYSRRFFEISIALLLGLVGAAANGQGQEAAFSHCRWRSLAIFRRILRRADFAIFEVKKKISHISRNWIASMLPPFFSIVKPQMTEFPKGSVLLLPL